jgi:hypothetical protein
MSRLVDLVAYGVCFQREQYNVLNVRQQER